MPEKQHLIKIMIQDVSLAVKVGRDIGQPFTTNIGTPQEMKEYQPIELEHSYARRQPERPSLVPNDLKDHS